LAASVGEVGRVGVFREVGDVREFGGEEFLTKFLG